VISVFVSSAVAGRSGFTHKKYVGRSSRIATAAETGIGLPSRESVGSGLRGQRSIVCSASPKRALRGKLPHGPAETTARCSDSRRSIPQSPCPSQPTNLLARADRADASFCLAGILPKRQAASVDRNENVGPFRGSECACPACTRADLSDADPVVFDELVGALPLALPREDLRAQARGTAQRACIHLDEPLRPQGIPELGAAKLLGRPACRALGFWMMGRGRHAGSQAQLRAFVCGSA
jgi:hypothetical protein